MEGAIRAGADIVCISHTASVAREAAERLLSLLEGGELDAGEFKAAVERALSAKHGLAAAGGRVQGPADTAEARELLERSFTLVRAPDSGPGRGPALHRRACFAVYTGFEPHGRRAGVRRIYGGQARRKRLDHRRRAG